MEENKILKRLDEVIIQELEDIKTTGIASDERMAITENLAKLVKLHIDENNLELERMKIQNQEIDSDRDWENKRASLRLQKNDRWFNIALQVGLSVVSILAYERWFNKGLKFEETGTITSPMTRNLLSKLLPKK